MEFGKTLRLAREAKGYTAAQVAELTRMAPSTVADLEEENFSRIAAPIYGRGFVKLYCEAVGIDPKPLVDEFMAIFRGERDVGIKERKAAEVAATEPPPAAPTMAEPAPQPPHADSPEPAAEESLFPEQQDLPATNGQTPPCPAPDPFASFQEAPEPAERPAQRTLSRYAAPVRTMHLPSVPPTVWRIGIVGALILLILWGLAAGVLALYHATTSDRPTNANVEERAEPQQKPAEPAPAAKPATPPAAKTATPPAAKTRPAPAKNSKPSGRTPQKIPSLYVD